MEKLLDYLWKDYEDAKKEIESVNKDHPMYEKLLEDRDKVRNELLKLKQLESENKRKKKRNIISIVSFIITTLVGIWTVIKAYKFDETATMTSTLGRSSVSNVVSKLFRK